MSGIRGLATAWRLARRELRGGLAGFRIFLACLMLGVATIAGVGSLAAAIVDGLRSDARALLGGDVELRLAYRQAAPAERTWLAEHGRLSAVAQMRSMARRPDDNRRTLIELKAVDGAYPLYGEVRLAPAQPLAAALGERNGRHGAAAEAALLDRLGLKLGEVLQVGEAEFEVRAVIRREPDRGTGAFSLGPRLMVDQAGLAATGLVQEGSLIYWAYRVALPSGTPTRPWLAALDSAFPDAGWRARDFNNGSPGVRQWIERLQLFLTLVGLTALLVGGVGVGNAVRSYLEGRTATIATLKCLGASGSTIFAVYLLQVLVLAAAGIVAGLAVGALLPLALTQVLADKLPVPPAAGFYPSALLLAATFGLLTALAFALWPLARAREVAPAGLFRDLVAPARRWPRPPYVAATGAAVAALALLAVATASDIRFALGFVAGAAASFILLRAVAAAVMAVAARAGRPRLPSLRLALGNLYRPGAATASVVLSLGLGLTVLVAVALIHGNLAQQVQDRLPAAAPAFFFIDIQPDQTAEFLALARATPGIGAVREVPMLRGRIVAVNGVPADQVRVAPGSQWALRSDRGLTYAETVPEGSTVVAGEWWPADYRGPPLISFDARIAADMGLSVGDTLTVNVLGRNVEATVANLRDIDWSTLGINFTVIFAPGTLEAAPHTKIATVEAAGPAAESAIYRAVTDRFPNVTAIRVKDALERVNELLSDIGRAVAAAASVTLLAGVLVLAGAMAAGHRRRVYDAVVLKVLGATRLDVLKSYLAEYALLGLIAAVIGAVLGWIAAWIVVTQVMGTAWVALPGTVLLASLVSVTVTILLGLAGTWRALSQRPAPVLRGT